MKFLDPDTERAVRVFLDRLPADIRLERAILFGSRVRGEATRDSDADLALIVHESADGLLWRLTGIAAQVFAETGIMIQPVPITIEDWLYPEDFPRPSFLRTVDREGIVM
jgi:predicted nucleotidyltransferase